MSKELLISMLEVVTKQTGMSQSEISLDMGYKSNYISEMLTPSGKVTDKFLNFFKSRYAKYLENRKLKDFIKDLEIRNDDVNLLNEPDHPSYGMGDLIKVISQHSDMLLKQTSTIHSQQETIRKLIEQGFSKDADKPPGKEVSAPLETPNLKPAG